MKRRFEKTRTLALFACAAIAWNCMAATQRGDITAAVRDDGKTVTFEADVATASAIQPYQLTDGKWNGQRYLSNQAAGPVTFTFSFPDAFIAGEDIVVTALTFTVGYNGSGGNWADYDKRMPKAFSVSGSNDGGTSWANIVSVGSFTDYAWTGSGTESAAYSGTVDFANWKSYRKYRIEVTGATGSSSYFLQLAEVAFHGLYGGSVSKPDPAFTDLTAQVRAANAQTIESNAGVANESILYRLSNATDGLYGYMNNRYLSNSTTTKELWDAGNPVTIDYTIGESFRRGADVIVTGYTIDVDKAHGGSQARLPKAWELQGWDGSEWRTLDRMTGFVAWDTVQHANEADGEEHPHYSYTFSITNSTSFRKYRLSVSEVFDRASSSDFFQLTELQLWGYADAEIAGTVGTSGAAHDFRITEDGQSGFFTPTLYASDYDTTPAVCTGSVTNLFDGKYTSAFLARMGVDGDERRYAPLTIGYAIPDTYLPGKEIVLKSYTLYSRTDDLSQYVKRAPKCWTLYGLGDFGNWEKIDRKTDFALWQTDAENRYYATIDLSDNDKSFRSYRLCISEVTDTSSFGTRTGMSQVLLYEISLAGQWGMGISTPVPPPGGTTVIVR